MKKIKVCMGGFVVTCFFRNVMADFAWAFVWVYGPNLDNVGSPSRRNLLVLLVGGICLGELVVISTSFVFLAKDRVVLLSIQQ